MSRNLRSTLMLVVAVAVTVGVTAMPIRAADESKALRKRIRQIERGLERMETNLASSRAEVQVLQNNLADTQVELGAALVNVQVFQDKLQYMTLVQGSLEGLNGPHIIFEGCNVHVRSGSGNTTDSTVILDSRTIIADTAPLGLGNLIVGYNEQPLLGGAERGGSHNLLVGAHHSYSTVGTAIFGQENAATGPLTSVTGGHKNEAQGYNSSVSAGYLNTANGEFSSVSGGDFNDANGESSSVSGGSSRTASSIADWRAGGLYEDS